MRRTARLFLATVTGLALVAAACGGDDEEASSTTAAGATTSSAPAAGQVLEVTATATGLTGLPDTVPGGVVKVRVTAEGDLDSPDFELDFSRVADGTTEEQFTQGLEPLFSGGPFPDFFLDNAGVGVGESSIELDEGEYIVWFEAGGDDEGEGEDGGPPEILTATLEVTAGSGGSLPEEGGTIVSTDYGFDVDVEAGETFTFRNDSTVQFHHAILLDFGTLDATTVEENLPAFIASEGEGPPPPAFADVDFDKVFAAGGSGVFGPGSAGTAKANLQSGHTYAVVCFIQDRTGGPPHVVGHDMFEVFTVD